MNELLYEVNEIAAAIFYDWMLIVQHGGMLHKKGDY